MKNYTDQSDYTSLVEDILEHNEFKKLGTIIHHGNNRLDHSLRVSYYSYKRKSTYFGLSSNCQRCITSRLLF